MFGAVMSPMVNMFTQIAMMNAMMPMMNTMMGGVNNSNSNTVNNSNQQTVRKELPAGSNVAGVTIEAGKVVVLPNGTEYIGIAA